MSRRVIFALLMLATIVLALVWTGVHMTFAYVRQESVMPGDLRQRAVTVPHGEAARVAVQIDMAAGSLNLTGGAAHLLDGYVSANSEWLYPTLDYSESGRLGLLAVGHQDLTELGSIFNAATHTATWDLQLSSSVSVSMLNANLGADHAVLDLRDIQLQAARIEILGGDLTINLNQSWPHDVNIELKAVSGRLTVRLPRDMGVVVIAEQEFGSVVAEGLQPLSGPADRYANAAYGRTPATLRVTADMALGTVRLIVE